jgi:Ca2+-transporting ATPase
VEVICTDKTGTLTEGSFQVEELLPPPDPLPETHPSEGIVPAPEIVALFACEKDPVDSMESAIHEKFKSDLSGLQGWELISDRPFDSTRKTMAHLWRETPSGRTILALKGAPEGILAGCSLLPGQREKIQIQIEKLAGQGKRLLGLASKTAAKGEPGASEEVGLQFLGLLVFSDPVRPSAKNAVAECEKAGIEIKMLTGDHPLTAHAVADELGIRHAHTGLHTGEELERMDLESRNRAYLEGSIFSRVKPEQKHELVKSLKAAGKIVAMTGDGMNDAPALKLADIGISMGKTATDTARGAAQMVLMENDFGGIVEAVLEGRKIFCNLKRSFSYLIFFHVPVILLALLPPFFAWGDLLLPIHILLLELVVHPVSAFTFENLPLSSTPKKERTLLDSRDAARHALAGLLLSGLALAGFRLAPGVDSGRSMALTTLLAGNIAYVLISTRGARSGRPMKTALALAGLLLIGALFGSVSTFLHLGPMDPLPWAASILTGFLAGFCAKTKG